MGDNCTLQNHLKQRIADSCRTRKRAVRDMVVELLGYDTLLRRNGVPTDNNNLHMREEVAVVQRRLLKNVTGKHELEW